MNRIQTDRSFSKRFLVIGAIVSCFISVGFIAPVSRSAGVKQAATVSDNSSDSFVTYQSNGSLKVRQSDERESELSVSRQTISAPGDVIQQGFFSLRTTGQLDGHPQAKAAYLRAAARWAEIIQLGGAVEVNLDFGPTMFETPFASPDMVAATTVQSFTLNPLVQTLSELLINNAANDQQAAILSTLPSPIKTDLGNTATYRITFAQGQSLGFQIAGALPPNTLAINSAGANFDFDSRDGIEAGKLDFDALAAREFGRILGFTSSVGNQELKPTELTRLTVWDLFRFRPSVNFNSIANGIRPQTSGGEQVFYAGGSVLPLSTGKPDGTGGDGNAAAHWKDNVLTGQTIGIMDPTFAPGERGIITINDVVTLTFLGHKVIPDVTVAEVLSVTDAVQEEVVPLNGDMVVNRFSPSRFPSKLEAVRISLPNGSSAAGASLRVVAWVEPMRTGQPQVTPTFLIDRTVMVSAVPANGLLEVLIPDSPSLGEGDLYVGIQSASANVRLGADVAEARRQFSFVSADNGKSFRLLKNAGQSLLNLNVQAVVTSAFSAENNLAPAIEAVSPTTVVPGGQDFTLHVYGKGFFPETKDNRGFLFDSVVRWNGEARATSFLDSNLLQVTITAADIAQAGKARVTVFTPRESGGLESPPLEFTITPNRPAPKLNSIEPNTAIVGSAAFKLAVMGRDFTAGSFVRVNGADRVTKLVSSTELTVDLTSADLANAGKADITVVAPAPGGGVSQSATLTIAPCRYSLSHQSQSFRTMTFGNVLFRQIGGTIVTPNGKCAWTARSNVPWITDIQPTGGDSIMPVTFRIADNSGAPRTGIVTIGNNILTVRQNGAVATVSAASYEELIAPNSIVTVFGNRLANSTELATGATLPTSLGGATVRIYRRDGRFYPAQFFFASPQQLNLLIPANLPVFDAPFPDDYLLSVSVNGQIVEEGFIGVAAIAPAFFTANADGRGVPAAVALRVKADGRQIYEPIAEFNATRNAFVSRPIDFGEETDQVFLLLFGTGLRGRTSLNAIKLKIGNVEVPVDYAGPQTDFAGLDQLNVRLPRSLKGKGEVAISCSVDTRLANPVTVTVK